MFLSQKTLDLYGRQWTMAFASIPAFDAAMDRYTPKFILAAGLVISLLIFSLFKTLEFTGAWAYALAREMTSALRESEEKYRTILEDIEDVYYEVALNGDFTFFNNSLCRILGYTKEELMGMNNRRYTDEQNAKKLFHAFNEVYRTGKPTQLFDWQVIRKDGTKRNVEASVSLIKDSSDKPIGFRGIVRDITERKHAEEALRESELMLRKSQEAAGIGSYTVDLIEDACKASIVLNDILGIPREDKHPMAVWSDIIHPEWREKVMRVHEAAVKNISRFDEEYIIIRKSDGTQRWVHDVGTVEVGGQGRPATRDPYRHDRGHYETEAGGTGKGKSPGTVVSGPENGIRGPAGGRRGP